jgi:acetyl esterase/lipase
MARLRFLCTLAVLVALVACSGETKETQLTVPEPAHTTLLAWPDLTGRPLPQPTDTLHFGDRPWNVVDIWIPDGAGPHPVVLMVHGGCWQKAIADRTLMNYAAEDLRKRGLAVWNIEYRGVDEDGGGYPGTFEDVARGADLLAVEGPKRGLRTDRIVAFGHSAGGHLAMWLAARSRLPADSKLRSDNPVVISAVVNSGGLADLEASKSVTQTDCLADIYDKLTGAPRANALADTSPAQMLPLGVKQVSVNGADDRIAPPVLGEAWTTRARAAGDDATAEIIPNSGHVELIAPGSAAFEREAQLLLELLK